MGQSIHILHVEDDPEFADLVSTFLHREDDRFGVRKATTPTEGLEILADQDIDCIVSDFDMPGRNGLELLETVREEYPDLPFILYTGKGSEEVASEAISAGVTDYLQKEPGTDQYAVLANRIRNAVEAHRFARSADHRQHQLEQILKTIPACVVRIDYDGQFVFANRRAENVLGLTKPEVSERTYNDPEWNITDLQGEPIPDEELPFRQVRDSGEPIHGYQHMIEWPDGTRRALLVNGAPIFDRDGNVESTVFALTDITDRIEREQKLELSEKRFRTLAEHFPNGAVLVFDTDLRYQSAHGEGFATADLDPAAFEGEHVSDVFEGETLATKRELYEATLAGESGQREMRFAGRVYRVHTLPIQDETGEIFGGIVMTQDITDYKQRERALERQNQRLEDFASLVSHDLQNPLTVAEGRLELGREECDNEHLESVARAHERMNVLIDDLLTVAREGEKAISPEPLRLADRSEACWRSVDTADATLVTDTDRTLTADPSQLQHLLENLYRNAVDHGGEEVTVTVGDLNDGFYVEDDGPGIPAEHREEVFDTGYSTSQAGTGFGLSIVKQVVEAHDWEIDATEGADGGTRFEITGVERAE